MFTWNPEYPVCKTCGTQNPDGGARCPNDDDHLVFKKPDNAIEMENLKPNVYRRVKKRRERIKSDNFL